jgi:hydroxymethylpyrimidine/phosphomethylpyrimidine kinase
MHDNRPRFPIVLAIGGHDPGGGAGIQADIETVAANGCHAKTVVTCVTVQDSCNLNDLTTMPASLVRDQVDAVLGDAPIAAIKIGLLGDVEIATTLAALLVDLPDIPLVLDPVLAAGGGTNLAPQTLVEVIVDHLLPLCSLITPNSQEARRLCRADLPLDAAAQRLIAAGARAALITGTHELTEQVENRLYDRNGLVDVSRWERLSGEYHGSGCTLAAAITAGLAVGKPLLEAVRHAQAYSWQSLKQGFRSGRCQFLPDRLFALRQPHQ